MVEIHKRAAKRSFQNQDGPEKPAGPSRKNRRRGRKVRRNNGKIVGILGTAIIHLTAAIIFMTYKLGN
jgi:hypothetical protein